MRRIPRSPHLLLAGFGLALLPAAAWAADTQLWTTAIVQGAVASGPGVQPMVWMEVQSRLNNDVSHLGQAIVRPGFGLRFGPDFNFLFGYQFQRNISLAGKVVDEHRMWQQLTVPLYRDPDHLIVTTRWRLEERNVEAGQDLGWRARAMVRLQAPLRGRGSAGPLLWSEALVGLNDTDWGQHQGLGQLRAFAGAVVPLNRHLNLEAGYMAQFDRTPGHYRTNNVASVTLNYRLGS